MIENNPTNVIAAFEMLPEGTTYYGNFAQEQPASVNGETLG